MANMGVSQNGFGQLKAWKCLDNGAFKMNNCPDFETQTRIFVGLAGRSSSLPAWKASYERRSSHGEWQCAECMRDAQSKVGP